MRLIPPAEQLKNDMAPHEVDVLVISPSEDIDGIAAKHVRELPRAIRFPLRGVGATRIGGATLTSYLLFEPQYCRALIGLPRNRARREEVL